jgi:hypothetical protein
MRPGRQDYQRALREARATLAAREDAGLPGEVGPEERSRLGWGLPPADQPPDEA